MLWRGRRAALYFCSFLVLASITLSYCSSTILPRFIIPFRYLDLFHDTRSYLLRVHYQTSPFFYLVPRSFVQRAEIPWLDLWKRAIQRRAPWLFTSEENYNGESFNRGYKCLLVNNSSWKGGEKKREKLSPDIPLYLVVWINETVLNWKLSKTGRKDVENCKIGGGKFESNRGVVLRGFVLFDELWLGVDEINGDRLEVILWKIIWLSSFFIFEFNWWKGVEGQMKVRANEWRWIANLQNNINRECRHFENLKSFTKEIIIHLIIMKIIRTNWHRDAISIINKIFY